MNTSLHTSPVKFSSHIRFVTGNHFDDLLWERDQDEMKAHGEYAHYPWEADSRVRLKKQGFTDAIYDCSAGGVSNGDQFTLFHLHPGRTLSRNASATKDAIRSDIVELSGKSPVRGFIAGGRAYRDGKEMPSGQLYQMLVNLMRDSGIQHISKIWGRKSKQDDGPLEMLYDVAQDTWYLHAQSRGRDVLSRADIDRTFKVVDIAEGDTLETPYS